MTSFDESSPPLSPIPPVESPSAPPPYIPPEMEEVRRLHREIREELLRQREAAHERGELFYLYFGEDILEAFEPRMWRYKLAEERCALFHWWIGCELVDKPVLPMQTAEALLVESCSLRLLPSSGRKEWNWPDEREIENLKAMLAKIRRAWGE